MGKKCGVELFNRLSLLFRSANVSPAAKSIQNRNLSSKHPGADATHLHFYPHLIILWKNLYSLTSQRNEPEMVGAFRKKSKIFMSKIKLIGNCKYEVKTTYYDKIKAL